jgi:hypothetical protein
VNYTTLIRALCVPTEYVAPVELRYDNVVARMLSRADLVEDVQGINASVELIRRTRGGEWPSGPVSEEFDFVDLVWHECEFREGYSYSYAVYTDAGQYLGCCYLYPMGRRTRLDEKLIAHDVDVSWWVTPDAYERGYYVKLYAALRRWIGSEFPFQNAYYSNREVPSPMTNRPG